SSLQEITGHQWQLLIALGKQRLNSLRNRFNETTVLSVFADAELRYLASAESTHPLRYIPPDSRPLSGLPSASQKIFLAQLTDPEATHILSKALSPAQFKKCKLELEEIRSSGIAFNHGETMVGMSAVAAGIFNNTQLVACLSIGG